MSLSRRDVIKTGAAAAVATAVPAALNALSPSAKVHQRPLGKTGWKASIYALGTAEVPDIPSTVRAVHALLDGGVNYLDTAPSYQGTRSERALGEVMKTRRKEVFLATKTLARDADGAYREVKESLERLQTRQIDTLQIHAVNDFGALDQVLGKGGAAEGLERAKKEGLIRFIGITGHTRPEVISRALDRYPFDSILVPVSVLDASLYDFADDVLPKANKLGIAIVGMKALKGIERAGGPFAAEEFLRYAWSLPISTLTIGLRKESEAKANLAHALDFKKMPVSDMRALEAKFKDKADMNTLWWKRR